MENNDTPRVFGNVSGTALHHTRHGEVVTARRRSRRRRTTRTRRGRRTGPGGRSNPTRGGGVGVIVVDVLGHQPGAAVAGGIIAAPKDGHIEHIETGINVLDFNVTNDFVDGRHRGIHSLVHGGERPLKELCGRRRCMMVRFGRLDRKGGGKCDYCKSEMDEETMHHAQQGCCCCVMPIALEGGSSFCDGTSANRPPSQAINERRGRGRRNR
jgi:hypothetical protein